MGSLVSVTREGSTVSKPLGKENSSQVSCQWLGSYLRCGKAEKWDPNFYLCDSVNKLMKGGRERKMGGSRERRGGGGKEMDSSYTCVGHEVAVFSMHLSPLAFPFFFLAFLFVYPQIFLRIWKWKFSEFK